MAHGPRYKVAFRRRREGRTDYPKRLKLLMSGEPRAVLRGTNRHFIAQLCSYAPQGDVTMASAHSIELKKYGWAMGTANVPAAYLTGLLLGVRAKEKARSAILDIGLQEPVANSRVFAAMKGAIDGGLQVPFGQKVAEDRLCGKHISKYATSAAGGQFAAYKKEDLAKIPEQFEAVKKKILGGN